MIEVLGSGSLEDAVASTLRKRMDIADVHVTNAAQAYAVVNHAGRKVAAAYYLAIESGKLFLIGGLESELSKTDAKRLCGMPSYLVDTLDRGPEQNTEWRDLCLKHELNHRNHLFRGAVLTSNAAPDIYMEGKVDTVIVTHPASQKSFDSNGASLLLPKEYRSYYRIQAVPMIDEKYCRPRKDDKNTVINTAHILAKNLSYTHSTEALTARLLVLARTPPILMISTAETLTPVAMSKEESTFEFFDSWGQLHNRSLGVNQDFILNNSLQVKHHLDSEKIAALKAETQLDNTSTPNQP